MRWQGSKEAFIRLQLILCLSSSLFPASFISLMLSTTLLFLSLPLLLNTRPTLSHGVKIVSNPTRIHLSLFQMSPMSRYWLFRTEWLHIKTNTQNAQNYLLFSQPFMYTFFCLQVTEISLLFVIVETNLPSFVKTIIPPFLHNYSHAACLLMFFLFSVRNKIKKEDQTFSLMIPVKVWLSCMLRHFSAYQQRKH